MKQRKGNETIKIKLQTNFFNQSNQTHINRRNDDTIMKIQHWTITGYIFFLNNLKKNMLMMDGY